MTTLTTVLGLTFDLTYLKLKIGCANIKVKICCQTDRNILVRLYKAMSSDLIGEYLTLDLNQAIKWADFRLDALFTGTMLNKLYTTGPSLLA
jgi:hypothetical protein